MYSVEYSVTKFIPDFNVSENYKVYASDYKANFDKAEFNVINYEISNNIKDNLVLRNTAESLYPHTFIFYPVPNKKSNYTISAGDWYSAGGNEMSLIEPTISTLWTDKKNEGPFGMAAYPMLSTIGSSNSSEGVRTFGFIYSYCDSMQIKSLRYNGREEFQTIHKNDTVIVNDGPVYYSLNITDRYNYKYFGCYSYLKGMYGERLDYGFSNSSITILDSNDNVVCQKKIDKYQIDPYTGSLEGAKIEMSTNDYYINGKVGKALLRYEMETTPPSLFTSIQSLQFLNHLNQIRSAFKVGEQANLRLILNGAATTSSIKLYFKFANETEWKSKSFSTSKNSFNENILETDISDLLHNPNEIDLKIEVEDNNKYKMSYTLEPAISVTEKKIYNNLNSQNTISECDIYPNPTTEYITIRNASGIKKIIVSDLNGRKLIDKNLTLALRISF